MDRGDELIETLEALMAERRRELGDPPTPEELLDYRDGRLSEERRTEIEAKLGAFPDAARALADLAAFPEVEPAPGVPELSDEDVKDRWLGFRKRLETKETTAPVRRIDEARQPAPPPSSPTPLPQWLPVAAILALAMVGAAFFVGRLTAPGQIGPPRDLSSNVPVVQLSPEGEDRTRSEAKSEALPPEADSVTLVLDLGDEPALAAEPETSYAVEISGPSGATWRAQGLRPFPQGTLHLSLTRPDLPAGTYRIEVFEGEGARRRSVATYELRLTRSAGDAADGR